MRTKIATTPGKMLALLHRFRTEPVGQANGEFPAMNLVPR